VNERRAAAIASALGALAVVLAMLLTGPMSRTESHRARIWLAVLAVALVGARAAMGPAARAIPWLRGALAVACTAGWFTYYHRSAAALAGIDDLSDITFYYLNSKYLDELGHYDLYPAMIEADLETADRAASRVEQVRDLRDDQLKPVSLAIAAGKEAEKRFTPARWAAFCHDADWLLARQSLGEIRYIYIDHGYNPPPTWSILGGTLASLVPVEQIKLVALVDFGLVGAAFAAVAVVFGPEPMLWGMLFFVVTFSGRWPVLGQALLRFDWLCALLAAMCALRRDRYGLAGALLGLAAASRVFPAIFLGAWLWEAMSDTWRARRIAPRHVRFAAGAVAVVALLSAAALLRYGPATCAESMSNLALHARSFSSHRVGAGVIATWRGELTRDDIHQIGGMVHREQQVQALQPTLQAIGVALVGVSAFAAWRTRRPAWEVIPWMIPALFAATNPQVNYWNLRIVAVVWHAAWLASPRDRWFHAAGLAILFATEIAVHTAFVAEYERHAVSAVSSWGIALWCGLLLGWLAVICARGPDQGSAAMLSTRKSPVAT
jgi:hypothetical protein